MDFQESAKYKSWYLLVSKCDKIFFFFFEEVNVTTHEQSYTYIEK